MAHQIHIQEAIRLTGKSRRTLYRDMDAGHLSYQIDARGRRYFDIAELIRVYGELQGPDGEPIAEPPAAPPAVSGHDIEQLIERTVAQAVADAVRPLVDEIRRLRQYQVEHLEVIEHQVKRLPAPGPHSARARGELIGERGATDDPHGLHELVKAMRDKEAWDAGNGEVH